MTGPGADTAFDVGVAAVRTAVEEGRKLWDDIVAGVNAFISTWPVLRDTMLDVFNKLAAVFAEAMDLLAKLLSERGDAAAVRQVALDWNVLVGGMASEQAGLVDRGQLESQGQWKGAAADKYLPVVISQKNALAAVKTSTDVLGETLNGIADATRNFWVVVAAESVVWIAAVTGSIVAGGPAGFAAAAAVTGVYLGAVARQETDLTNELAGARLRIEQIEQSDESFAGGNWPSPQSDALSDASVQDGDKTDWTPNT